MTIHPLILLAHGSRDPDWRAPFEALTHGLAPLPVHLAYMEMATPTLATVVDAVIAGGGVTHINILPLFMAQGGHLKHDVPDQVTAMQQQYPQVTFTLLPPVGQHPAVVEAMRQACAAYCQPG
jgi:sirohydrochlorin cobaltochelatase